ncbi:MAG: META domain-containing protein [Pseudooceanicola sp.]|nr:META domain-containing protein [Pseudooceanicola sp.]
MSVFLAVTAIALSLGLSLEVPAMSERQELTGHWRITWIADGTLPPDAEVSLAFTADGRMFGKASCRMYRTEYKLDDDTLSFGEMRFGNERCPSDTLKIEADVLRSLRRANRFQIEQDGSLLLSTFDNPRVRASRAP